MQPISSLKPGDKYADGKYIVRDNDGESVGITRLSDGWLIRIYKHQKNFNHLVKKDI